MILKSFCVEFIEIPPPEVDINKLSYDECTCDKDRVLVVIIGINFVIITFEKPLKLYDKAVDFGL